MDAILLILKGVFGVVFIYFAVIVFLRILDKSVKSLSAIKGKLISLGKRTATYIFNKFKLLLLVSPKKYNNAQRKIFQLTDRIAELSEEKSRLSAASEKLHDTNLEQTKENSTLTKKCEALQINLKVAEQDALECKERINHLYAKLSKSEGDLDLLKKNIKGPLDYVCPLCQYEFNLPSMFTGAHKCPACEGNLSVPAGNIFLKVAKIEGNYPKGQDPRNDPIESRALKKKKAILEERKRAEMEADRREKYLTPASVLIKKIGEKYKREGVKYDLQKHQCQLHSIGDWAGNTVLTISVKETPKDGEYIYLLEQRTDQRGVKNILSIGDALSGDGHRYANMEPDYLTTQKTFNDLSKLEEFLYEFMSDDIARHRSSR